MKWLWWPLLGLFYVFVYLSWTAHPMFNLMLRFDRFGRHVLSADQRLGANWFGGVLLLGAAAVAWWVVGKSDVGLYAAIMLAILSICVAATFGRTGRHRAILGACTATLAALAVGAGLLTLAGSAMAMGLITAFVVGFIGFQLLANT